MALKLITPPALLAVPVADTRQYLRIERTDQDALIGRLTQAAASALTRALNHAIMPQTWELQLDYFTPEIQLPMVPIASIASVHYDDSDGAEQTLSPSAYAADLASQPPWLVAGADGWPGATLSAINAVRIRYVAGYADAADFAARAPDLLTALQMLVGDLYANPEAQAVARDGALMENPRWRDILAPFKVWI